MFSRQDLYEQMGLLEIVREYVAIVRESVKENVHYDSVATTVEQERAVNSVEPVMVRVAEGEQLIQKNSVVTEEMMKRVRAMQLIVHRYSSQQVFGRILFALIITLGSVYAFSQVFIHIKRGRQYTMLFMAGIVVTLLLTYGIIASRAALQVEFLDPLLPVFFLPLFLYVLTGKRRAGMYCRSRSCRVHESVRPCHPDVVLLHHRSELYQCLFHTLCFQTYRYDRPVAADDCIIGDSSADSCDGGRTVSEKLRYLSRSSQCQT